MTKHFQHELDRLKKKMLHLVGMVEEALQSSVRSITERDTLLAQRVIDSDLEIDALEVEVEEECLKILALHQPVAADLRYLVAVLKITNDLERIADLAVNIAERTWVAAQWPSADYPYDLNKMLELAVGMVRDSVDALVTEDCDKARQVCMDDDDLDDRHRVACDTIQKQLCKDTRQTEFLLAAMSVSRNLERIADHSTNIAEDVIYMIEGDIVRHQGGNGQSSPTIRNL